MEVFLTLILNFISTWLVGLTIPVVLRFVILRKPLGRTWAVVITGAVFVFNVLLFTYIKYLQEGYSSDGEISYVQGFIALAAYHILRRSKRGKANDSDTQVQKVRQDENLANAFLNPKPHKKWLLKPIMISFIILALMALIAGAFYWYELRPTKVRKECQMKVDKFKDELSFAVKYWDLVDESKIKQVYEDCLHSKGL